VLILRKHHEKTCDAGKYVGKRERTIYTVGHITAIFLIIGTSVGVFATVAVTFSATTVTLANVNAANDVHGNARLLENALDCRLDYALKWARDQKCTTCKSVIETAMLNSKFIFICVISLIIEAVVVLCICPCLNLKTSRQTEPKCYRMPKEIINPLLLNSKERLNGSSTVIAI